MITQEQAERIAGEITGQTKDDGLELIEFDAGWLVRDSATSDASLRGGALRVIERDSGRVMRFPSSVPPSRILSDYAQVVDRGQVET